MLLSRVTCLLDDPSVNTQRNKTISKEVAIVELDETQGENVLAQNANESQLLFEVKKCVISEFGGLFVIPRLRGCNQG